MDALLLCRLEPLARRGANESSLLHLHIKHPAKAVSPTGTVTVATGASKSRNKGDILSGWKMMRLPELG
jgi:predicted polyphosphate/ATP-dependent NAD kinase